MVGLTLITNWKKLPTHMMNTELELRYRRSKVQHLNNCAIDNTQGVIGLILTGHRIRHNLPCSAIMENDTLRCLRRDIYFWNSTFSVRGLAVWYFLLTLAKMLAADKKTKKCLFISQFYICDVMFCILPITSLFTSGRFWSFHVC